jgi:hypothetical protein
MQKTKNKPCLLVLKIFFFQKQNFNIVFCFVKFKISLFPQNELVVGFFTKSNINFDNFGKICDFIQNFHFPRLIFGILKLWAK